MPALQKQIFFIFLHHQNIFLLLSVQVLFVMHHKTLHIIESCAASSTGRDVARSVSTCMNALQPAQDKAFTPPPRIFLTIN